VAHYSLPLGYWSVGATVSASRYYQNVAGLNQNYIYRGTTENAEANLSRIVWRDAVRKTELRLKAFQRRSNNYIDDTEVMVQRRVVGGWELAVGHKDAIGQAKIEGTLSYKRGTGDFDTLPAPEEASGDGTARFGLLLLDATLTLPFKVADPSLRYSGTLRIQNNTTPLTPQDRIAIGSRYSVRGFDGENVLSAERGWLIRNELSAPLADSGQQVYLGLDYGEVGGPSSELLLGKTLAGTVLGLRGGIKKLQYDVFIGTPLHKPNGFKTANTTAGFSVILAW
jgi:hemolysin activation/secretion protein